MTMDARSIPFPLAYRTLPEALHSAPGSATFITMCQGDDDRRTVTFGEFHSMVAADATWLRLIGIEPGHVVILIVPQGIRLMGLFAALMELGAIPAILAYPNFKVDPAKYRFGLSGVSANLGARAILVDEAFPEEVVDLLLTADHSRIHRVAGGPVAGHSPPAPAYQGSGDAIAFIQHSSGTTGLQKGVALSHSAIIQQINALGPALGLSRQDAIYSWLPLYHDMGLIAGFLLPMMCHLPIVLQSPIEWVMQPGTMLNLMTEYQCTLAWLPNFAFQFLARRVPHEERSGLELGKIRALINCSEPVRARSMDEFHSAYEVYGLRSNALQTSYAMAETVFAVTQSPLDGSPVARIFVDGEALRREHTVKLLNPESGGAVELVSCGHLLPGFAVQIVSDDGLPLADGLIGEIIIRSKSMLTGYYKRTDLTSAAVREGWYWSGDLGFQWAGELFVVGRRKDLIIVGGQNIYPQDVEEIVASHPTIRDGRAVAFGLFNEALGTEEIVVVAEVESEKDLDLAQRIEIELRNAVGAQIGVVPRAVFLKPPKWIIKSTAGKPARSTTREKLLAEHSELRQKT